MGQFWYTNERNETQKNILSKNQLFYGKFIVANNVNRHRRLYVYYLINFKKNLHSSARRLNVPAYKPKKRRTMRLTLNYATCRYILKANTHTSGSFYTYAIYTNILIYFVDMQIEAIHFVQKHATPYTRRGT